jgi:transcription antitermination factor NusG
MIHANPISKEAFTPIDLALPELFREQHWFAAYTASRHEKKVAEHLAQRSVDAFLPLYEAVRRWNNMRARVQLPLFPGYVFVRIALRDRLQVLQLPSVVRLVSFNGQPAVLPDAQMETLRNALAPRLRAKPCPYLSVGRRVRIKSGPLTGLEGILLRRKGNCRFVLSVDLIQRSVAADVDINDIEPTR